MNQKEIEKQLALLRKPFPEHLISKLPKQAGWMTKAKDEYRNCPVCGGYHHPKAVHLDYVGHAALTDRLLDVDPYWIWEPLATTEAGLPQYDNVGGLWIKLTVCGVTRLGYGSADGKQGPDAIKEVIGDALRNAAMRFGAALDLWHKGDLHIKNDDNVVEIPRKAKGSKQLTKEQMKQEVSESVDAIFRAFDDGDDIALEQLLSELSREPQDKYAGHTESQIVWNFLPGEVRDYITELKMN